MSIEVICVGTELLNGHTLNTNLRFIGHKIAAAGLELTHEQTVSDEPGAISAAVAFALTRSSTVITIGGLGPTQDDVTRIGVAGALGVGVGYCDDVAATVRNYVHRQGRTIKDDVVMRQAQVIDGAVVLPNRTGTAPGLWCTTADKAVVLLPGPPHECQAMFNDEVVPRLLVERCRTVCSETISVYGLSESSVEADVASVIAPWPMVSAAFCVDFIRTDVHLRTAANNAAVLVAAATAVRQRLRRHVIDGDAGVVGDICTRLRTHGWRWATAESCTGGRIAAMITNHAGVSDVFSGSVVTYSNAMKTQLLGVSPQTLASHGAVSAETAAEMAAGLAAHFAVDVGVAVTGIAGPSGGSDEKPVGLVYFGFVVDGQVDTQKRRFLGDRRTVRERASVFALLALRERLMAKS